MPIQNFVPLIGSGFDSLAQQQQNWAGFNRGVEENNLARLAAAQQQQNDWLRTVAAMRDQAVTRNLNLQLGAQEARSRAADVARQEAEQRREFDVGTQLENARVGAETARTSEMGKIAEENMALQQHAARQRIDAEGQTAASNYLVAKNNSEAAAKAYDDLQQKADQIDQQIYTIESSPKPDKAAIAKATYLKSQQARVSKELAGAAKNKTDADAAFQRLVLNIGNKGFNIDLENNQIVHPATGAKWSFKSALKTAKDNADTAPAASPVPPGQSALDQIRLPEPWPGFVQTGADLAVPPAPIVAPLAPAPPGRTSSGLRYSIVPAQ